MAEKLRFQSCKQGSPYTVNYISQVPNGDSITFRGWPDFSIVKNTIFHAQRRAAKLAGIGEVQSPPGVKEKSKTAAIAQARIYGVGELTKCNEVTIVIIFNKSALVALSTLSPTQTLLENSIGEPSYKVVN